MNLKRVNLVGWEENSGVALDGFQPIMLKGYPRVKPQSVCVQQPQPHPLQPSNQLPQHHQLLDTPPPQLLPPTVTGPILVPRKYLVSIRSGIHISFPIVLIDTSLVFTFLVGPPMQPIRQTVKDGMHGPHLHQPAKILHSVFHLHSYDSDLPLRQLPWQRALLLLQC